MTSEEIINIRKNLNMSRNEFSHFLSIPYETLCRWENGKRSPSNFYEAKLRSIAGKVDVGLLQEQCILIRSNVEHIKAVVAKNEGPVFGTVLMLSDEQERVYVVTIRLFPRAKNLGELDSYIRPSSLPPRIGTHRSLAFFIAADRIVHPRNVLRNFVLNQTRYCVVYNRSEDGFAIWKLRHGQDAVEPIPYTIVG